MQKKITAKQNKQHTTDKVVVVKKNNGKLVCFVWLLFSFACRWQFDRLLFG
jgi:hypothetical protein